MLHLPFVKAVADPHACRSFRLPSPSLDPCKGLLWSLTPAKTAAPKGQLFLSVCPCLPALCPIFLPLVHAVCCLCMHYCALVLCLCAVHQYMHTCVRACALLCGPVHACACACISLWVLCVSVGPVYICGMKIRISLGPCGSACIYPWLCRCLCTCVIQRGTYAPCVPCYRL